MPTPYTEEDELLNGAFNSSIGWTLPMQIGIPLLDDLVDTLFPICPGWAQPIRDKWEWFVDSVKDWFHLRDGSTIQDQEELGEMFLAACASAALTLEIDLWDEAEGLPSMPADIPIGGAG